MVRPAVGSDLPRWWETTADGHAGTRAVATQELSARPLEWNPPARRSRVPYLPGLDGMRALAVVAVILYHTNNGGCPEGSSASRCSS